jgi:hypothetical protein
VQMRSFDLNLLSYKNYRNNLSEKVTKLQSKYKFSSVQNLADK